MRVLIAANSFHPSVGGYERVTQQIAELLIARGVELKIVTLTLERGKATFPFEVVRNPSSLEFLSLVRWSQIYLQNNVSLRLLWPLLLIRRPLVVVHHGFYSGSRGAQGWLRDQLKRVVTLVCRNIAVSRAVGASLPGRSLVSLNPYRDDVFFRIPSISKTRDLVFVGRVVSDKGIDLLIEAVAELRKGGISPTLTIAGSGPEEGALKSMVRELGLADLIAFAGHVRDEDLNRLLNTHRIMVVPTRRGEGFGVVALEGIAAGCVVVGSSDGGLPEAIGPCGSVFPKGDARALAQALRDILENPGLQQAYLASAAPHLAVHLPNAVVDRYLEVFRQILPAEPK